MLRDDIQKLKLKLAEISHVSLPDEIMDEFLNSMTEIRLNTYGVITPSGEVDTNVYICKEGIVRFLYKNGNRAVTHVFASPGNVIVSWHSFYKGQPSFYQVEACCKHTVVLCMTKEVFDSFVERYHIFSKWLISIYQQRLYAYERKICIFNGDAKHRFEALLETKPEIMNQVPLGIIASYLAITPQYLSTLRKHLVIQGRTRKA